MICFHTHKFLLITFAAFDITSVACEIKIEENMNDNLFLLSKKGRKVRRNKTCFIGVAVVWKELMMSWFGGSWCIVTNYIITKILCKVIEQREKHTSPTDKQRVLTKFIFIYADWKAQISRFPFRRLTLTRMYWYKWLNWCHTFPWFRKLLSPQTKHTEISVHTQVWIIKASMKTSLITENADSRTKERLFFLQKALQTRWMCRGCWDADNSVVLLELGPDLS